MTTSKKVTHLVGEYEGDPGVYAGLVGMYEGDDGEYDGDVGLHPKFQS